MAQRPDSVWVEGKRVVTLDSVVVGRRLDVADMIRRIQQDTSFYKAFRNLRILGFTALNDLRMQDRKNNTSASLHSRTRQVVRQGCRTMQVLEEQVTGDFYESDSSYAYYTASLYASLFFTRGRICHETNVVGEPSFSLNGKKGMDRHREQLKMLFFNPGHRISGLPFMSGKTAIFDEDMASQYDFQIRHETYKGQEALLFQQTVKPGREHRVIVNEMKTWFADSSFQILGRNYSMSYRAGVYDFDVSMQVEMTRFGEWTVPSLIRYVGDWKILWKKRERGVFTATLFGFERSLP